MSLPTRVARAAALIFFLLAAPAFAEGKNPDDTPNGRITALAPNYESGGFDPHQVLMWIRRDTLVTSGPAGTRWRAPPPRRRTRPPPDLRDTRRNWRS